MINNPLVSIIIATYRRENELKRALESITHLEYSNYEIIIVDDNSDCEWNKRVNRIVDTFLDAFSKTSLKLIVNESNKGSAETRNIGIREASGEYVCFLDDDDVFLPNRIERQLQPMIKNNADYSITDLSLYNEQDVRVEVRTRDYIKDTSKKRLLQYHFMYHMTGTDTLMFRKDYIQRIGGFGPVNVGDEFYLMNKAILNEGRFLYVPTNDVKAYVHKAGGGISSGDEKINGENQLYKYKKEYFEQLDKETIKYIKVRHYFVLAYSNLKSKKYVHCAGNLLRALVHGPRQSLDVYRKHTR